MYPTHVINEINNSNKNLKTVNIHFNSHQAREGLVGMKMKSNKLISVLSALANSSKNCIINLNQNPTLDGGRGADSNIP